MTMRGVSSFGFHAIFNPNAPILLLLPSLSFFFLFVGTAMQLASNRLAASVTTKCTRLFESTNKGIQITNRTRVHNDMDWLVDTEKKSAN